MSTVSILKRLTSACSCYRDGALSTFGHNHVVSLKDFKGTIHLQPKLEQSRVELEIPVDRLIVDDASATASGRRGFRQPAFEERHRGNTHEHAERCATKCQAILDN